MLPIDFIRKVGDLLVNLMILVVNLNPLLEEFSSFLQSTREIHMNFWPITLWFVEGVDKLGDYVLILLFLSAKFPIQIDDFFTHFILL